MILEICAASVEDCLAAQNGGADRLELNSALAVGGLTPSLGLLQEARQSVHLPIIAMIRPRASGFYYSAREFAVMQRDIDLMLAHGAAGIAFGILDENGKIDRARCAQIIHQTPGAEIVFHRAFDITPDPLPALEQLIDLGVKRVVTSGQEKNVSEGADNIARFIRHANRRIEILPAGGINRDTLAGILRRTGCDQVHASLSIFKTDLSTRARPRIQFGSSHLPAEDCYSGTDAAAVAEVRERLNHHMVKTGRAQ